MKGLFIILICFFFTGIAFADLNEGLIAHYSFDGNVEDISGNENHGEIEGTTLEEALVKDRFLRQDKAFNFDGVDDYIRISLSETLDIITHRITMSIWINIVEGLGGFESPQHYIFDSRDGEGGYAFNVDTDFIQFWIGPNPTTFSVNIDSKEWCHLVVTYSEEEYVSLYINGELTNREPFEEYFLPTTGPSWIGQRFNFVERFYGKIDDLRIYDRILSEIEISELYEEEPEPVADFIASPISGVYPLTVNFTDQSTENIISWLWDFGDGVGTSPDQNPTYIYNTAGTYTVELTVTDLYGTDTETKNDYIVVQQETPVANFTADNTSGDAPLTVNFTNESTGNIDIWEWDFGDESGTSTEQDPSYEYNDPGTYTVRLTVTSPGGTDTLTKTDYITVNSSDPPPEDDEEEDPPPEVIIERVSSTGCFVETIK